MRSGTCCDRATRTRNMTMMSYHICLDEVPFRARGRDSHVSFRARGRSRTPEHERRAQSVNTRQGDQYRSDRSVDTSDGPTPQAAQPHGRPRTRIPVVNDASSALQRAMAALHAQRAKHADRLGHVEGGGVDGARHRPLHFRFRPRAAESGRGAGARGPPRGKHGVEGFNGFGGNRSLALGLRSAHHFGPSEIQWETWLSSSHSFLGAVKAYNRSCWIINVSKFSSNFTEAHFLEKCGSRARVV